VIIIYSHWPNIQRLIAGTERRVGEKGKPQG
jgi:glycerol-3-phosphate acyltransferase PlsY